MIDRFRHWGASLLTGLFLILSLPLAGHALAEKISLNMMTVDIKVTNPYHTYRIHQDSAIHPGLGMRYSVQQDWFLFGETHHANHVTKNQEPRLFHPDEPRVILLGGGVYF